MALYINSLSTHLLIKYEVEARYFNSSSVI